jgi:hypothetical protein
MCAYAGIKRGAGAAVCGAARALWRATSSDAKGGQSADGAAAAFGPLSRTKSATTAATRTSAAATASADTSAPATSAATANAAAGASAKLTRQAEWRSGSRTVESGLESPGGRRSATGPPAVGEYSPAELQQFNAAREAARSELQPAVAKPKPGAAAASARARASVAETDAGTANAHPQRRSAKMESDAAGS